MSVEKYNTNHLQVNQILGLIASNDIAIPEIQRPFVWKNRQVRDLLDSLYKGFPTGYIIIWKNHGVKLKDGTISKGQKIMIDGQQRITALMTAIAGVEVINSDYKKGRVKIAFDPFAALEDKEDAVIFEVQDQSHLKSKRWVEDVAIFFTPGFSSYNFIRKYTAENPEMDPDDLSNVISKVKEIGNRHIGVIELSDDLDIDTVTEIFIRINSKGTALSQGDFVMSKIAADEEHEGNQIRKAIDYFSHLAKDSSYYATIKERDLEFSISEYNKLVEWLKEDKETVFDPECDDIIRIAFMHKFKRSKLKDLVNLLSGRNFQTKEYEARIIDETYATLKEGIANVMNQYNFTQFMLAIKSAGFISERFINSNMALDFAYTLHLILKENKEVEVSEVKRIVQKWYVLSVLTGRYTGSPESAFAKDLKSIAEVGVKNTLKNIEDAILSDNFWDVKLVQDLAYNVTNNPTFLVFLAAQVHNNEVSLLSNNVTVSELIKLGGDVHHIFPKQYLKDHGYEKNLYNQIANYTYLDRPVNISIGKSSPSEYFNIAFEQCLTGNAKVGSIISEEQLLKNLEINCIPLEVKTMDYSNYKDFLELRRRLMAKKIKDYYYSL